MAEQLEPDVRERFERVVATDWIPVGDVAAIYSVAARLLHPGRARPVHALGRDLARMHLTGIYRVILRLVTAETLLGQSGRLWSTYNAKGRLVVVDASERAMDLVLLDYPDYPAVVRESLSGYIAGAAELTGATDVRVVHGESDPARWTYDVRWR